MSCDAGQKLIGGGYSNNDGGGSYAWVSLPMYTGDSITNAFWTQTATKDEYFATSGSSGTSLTAYAICVPQITTTSNSCSAQQFSSQSAFVAATSATAGSLTGILENNRYYNYTFSDIGVSLDFNVSASAHFGGVYTTTRLPYKVWAMGYEDIDVSFTPAVNAFGFDFVEPINDPADCR